MNKMLKKEIANAFYAPMPDRRDKFLSGLNQNEQNKSSFLISQIFYIRKRFYALSLILIILMYILSYLLNDKQYVVSVISSILPFLSVIALLEICRSHSYNMAEMEMSCKYNLQKIILMRLCIISSLYFILILTLLIVTKKYCDYSFIRFFLYSVTPFLLSSYISLAINNISKNTNSPYISIGFSAVISVTVFLLPSISPSVYSNSFVYVWFITFIVLAVLIGLQGKKLILKGGNYNGTLPG